MPVEVSVFSSLHSSDVFRIMSSLPGGAYRVTAPTEARQEEEDAEPLECSAHVKDT